MTAIGKTQKRFYFLNSLLWFFSIYLQFSYLGNIEDEDGFQGFSVNYFQCQLNPLLCPSAINPKHYDTNLCSILGFLLPGRMSERKFCKGDERLNAHLWTSIETQLPLKKVFCPIITLWKFKGSFKVIHFQSAHNLCLFPNFAPLPHLPPKFL